MRTAKSKPRILYKAPTTGHFEIKCQFSILGDGPRVILFTVQEDGYYTSGSQPERYYHAGEVIEVELDANGRPK